MHLQSRWAHLFADLEAQYGAAEALELQTEVADRTRGELAGIALVNRLRAQVGTRVELRVHGAPPVVGTMTRVGADWALVASDQTETVVMLDAVTSAVDLPPEAVSPTGVDRLAGRLGCGTVLRALARDRAKVRIQLRDGSTVIGTPDRVGADFVEIASHPIDQAPRIGQVRARWTIAWCAIAVLVRDSGADR